MMIRLPTSRRQLAVALLAALVVASTGCSWFRGKSGYEQSPEHRPLEIPPGLDAPNTTSAMRVPELPASAGATTAQTASGSGDFVVADQVGSAWRRVGLALERIDGVEIKDRAELISAYTVVAGGQQFLLRISEDSAGSRVSASDSNSRPVTSSEAARVLGELKTRLGG
jgi:uncharacterized lipoprotein